MAACARAFCERIEQAGYDTLVYGNKRDIARFGGDVPDGRPVWFAEYDVAVPTGQFDFVMWQYTSTGTVAGITPRGCRGLTRRRPKPAARVLNRNNRLQPSPSEVP